MYSAIKISLFIFSAGILYACSSSRYTEMGIRSYENKQYPQAIEYFNKAAETGENTSELYYYRGLSNVNLAQYSEGCKDLEKARDMGYELKKEDLFFLGCPSK